MGDEDARTPGGRARLVDVAEAAGVTKAVVSRLLNGDESLRIRPETRDRVLRTARELGYRPNASAKALSLARTGLLALLVPDLSNPVYSAITRGAMAQAGSRGYSLLVAEGDDEAAARDHLDLIDTGRVDGILVGSSFDDSPLVARLTGDPSLVPHVFVNREVAGSGRNVGTDLAGASEAVVARLAELGHREIGLVTGPPTLSPSVLRLEGFRAGVAAHGLGPGAVAVGAFTEPGGYAATTELLAARPGITAVFASSFGQGAGALAALRDAGREVPRDTSVIAYDDLPMAQFTYPRLSTVAMPLRELGESAVDALLDQVDGDTGPGRVTVPGWRIVERDSLAQAPRA